MTAPAAKSKTPDTARRFLFTVLAWSCLVLGLVGTVLPLMPTTVFLLVAAWAFARSDERRYRWLREHAQFGEMVRAWEQHHAMPRRAKRLALAALAASYLLMATVFGPVSWAAILGGLCIAGVALYVAHLPVIGQVRKRPIRS